MATITDWPWGTFPSYPFPPAPGYWVFVPARPYNCLCPTPEQIRLSGPVWGIACPAHSATC